MTTDLFSRFTESSREVLQLSLREALSLGHNYIGPEHLLLAIMRQQDSKGFLALESIGATKDAVVQAVLQQLTLARRQERDVDWQERAKAAEAELEHANRRLRALADAYEAAKSDVA